MDKRVMLAAGGLVLALAGSMTYATWSSRSQKASDQASLRLQQSFMPRRGPGGPGGPEGPGGGMDRMAQELGLTADQQVKMKAVREEMRAGAQPGQRPDREAIQAIRAKMDSILTPDQREKMKSMRPAQGGPGGPGGPPPEGGMGGPPPSQGA